LTVTKAGHTIFAVVRASPPIGRNNWCF